MPNTLEKLLRTNIEWQKTEGSSYVFTASFDGKEVKLRLNDFPEEPLCTLFTGDQETQIHEFPKCWTLPRHREN